MTYAAMIEDITTDMEDRLVRQHLPAGVRADDDFIAFDIGRDTNARRPFQAGDIGFLNEDTLKAAYMVSERVEDPKASGWTPNNAQWVWNSCSGRRGLTKYRPKLVNNRPDLAKFGQI